MAKAGLKPQVACHVRATGRNLEVAMNGQRLENPSSTDDWLDLDVPPEVLKQGSNRLAFRSRPQEQAAGQADPWTLVWQAPALPGPPWKKMGFARDCVAEMRDGKLLLADRGTSAGTYAFFQDLGAVRPEDEVVVEVRMQLLSGWSSVLVENGVAGEEIMFYPDRVTLRHSGLSNPMKTTDAFHTYRIVIRGQDLKVHADGQLRLDGTRRFTHPAPNGRSGVAFGGANSPSMGEALWESVRIRNPAVSLLDVALSIRYQGR